MQPNLSMVLEQVGKDKGIDKKVLVQTLEQAIMTAAKKVFGLERELEAQFNEETGQVDLFQVCIVTETAGIKGRDIGKADADRQGLRAEVGDELLFQIFYTDGDADKASEQERKYGDILDLHDTIKRFGRIAAQTAKQVIIQRIREAERENTFNEYRDRKGELINGTVRRFERGNIIVDLGKTEAILPAREQVPRENYRIGDRIMAYVVDIEKNARGPQIVLSRASKGLLEKLFEQEVSEIYEKIVRIESSAREPGSRSKIAVSSRDRDVDPVGACVGIKGSRVQAVVQELRGEKIDIVPYSEDPARFVCNAIAPAEVSRVVIDAEAAAIVRRVFDLYVAGQSYDAIAHLFNAERVPYARLGKKFRRQGWVGSSVRAILQNRAYIGEWTWNKREWRKVPGTNKRRPRLRRPEEVIVQTFPERRIVATEIWDLVRRRASAVTAKYKGKGGAAMAPGLPDLYDVLSRFYRQDPAADA
mgnify:CR=1 FL=1